MCFALFMIMLDNTVVNVALPSIQQDLGASISGLEWTINGYTLSFAVLLATGGRLGDIFGRRRMFLSGVVIFALSSATAGFAPDETALVISRVVQGVGAALMMPGTLSIITDAFPAHERGKAMGTWAGVSALALAVGPVLGGFLTEHVSWRAIFYINIPVAIGAVIATLFAVRESRDTSVGRDVDYAGVAVLTAGLTALVLALVEGNAWGWGSTQIVALLGLAAVALPAFVFVENRVKAPMVQFDLLSDRNFLACLRGPDHHLLDDGRLLLPRPLHAGHPRLLAAGGGDPVPALDPDDRRRGTGGRAALGPLRPALADRRRPDHRRRLAVQLQSHPGRLRLPRPAARVHAARHRRRDDDVADDQRRDERGAGAESRDRFGRALDVPDGRRPPRHRRHRRDLPGAGQLQAGHAARRVRGHRGAAAVDLRPARRRDGAEGAGARRRAGEGDHGGRQRSVRLRCQSRDDRLRLRGAGRGDHRRDRDPGQRARDHSRGGDRGGQPRRRGTRRRGGAGGRAARLGPSAHRAA